MVRSMLRDIRQAMICLPNGAWLRKLWDTSKSHLEDTPEPVAETALDETLTHPQLVQDDSQMLVVPEDAQPQTLEDTLGDQGVNSVESTTDYFVWFRFPVEAPLGARTMANHLSKLPNCKRRRMVKVGTPW